jgi:hypothetical protein
VTTRLPPLHLDVDVHGRVTPRDDATRRALADRAGRFVLLPSATDLLLAHRAPVVGTAAARPRCVLAGDLSGFAIVDFMAFIHQSRVTGVLTVASDGAERAITFKDGEVRGAESTAAGERLEDVAVRLGFTTAAQVAAMKATQEPIVRALVSGGLVSPNDVWKCVHEQVGSVFHAILLARQGVFLLVDEDTTERTGSTLTVNTQSLLMDGIRRIDEMSLFQARIPGPAAVLRRREPRRPVPLNAVEQQILQLVDGRRPLAAIAAAAHLNEFDATKTLYHLAEAGYVEPVGGTGGSVDSVEALAEAFDQLLRRVTSAVPAERLPGFVASVRAFLADPAGPHAPLWQGLSAADDGAIDRAAVVERLAALPAPVVQRLQGAGDRRALAREALRDLLYFQLFAVGGLLSREADDALSAELKHRLAAIEGPGE